MKVLIIVQDLRVSGTSEGIVSRSFISKLKMIYPDAIIDLHYFITYSHDNIYIWSVNECYYFHS